jgi:hypothetical protein
VGLSEVLDDHSDRQPALIFKYSIHFQLFGVERLAARDVRAAKIAPEACAAMFGG